MLFYTCKTRVSHYLNLAGVKCSSKKEKNEDTRDSKHMFCAFKTQEFATSHHSHHWNPIAQKVKVFTIKVGSLIDIQFPDGVLDKSTTTNKVSLSYSYLFPECHFSTLFVTFVRAVKGTGILTREIFQRRDSYHQHIPLEYLSRFSLVVKYKKMKWSVYFLRYDIPWNSIFQTVWKFYINRIIFM